MSILIKDMEMPKSCTLCELLKNDRSAFYCPVQSKEANLKANLLIELYANCPLVLIPPHGRLIDADALKKVIKDEADFIEANCGEDEHSFKIGSLGAFARARGYIRDAPTIIEAENPTQCNNSKTEGSWTQIVCKCGGKRFIAQGDIVVCDKCGALLSLSDAYAAWNRRANDIDAPTIIESEGEE